MFIRKRDREGKKSLRPGCHIRACEEILAGARCFAGAAATFRVAARRLRGPEFKPTGWECEHPVNGRFHFGRDKYHACSVHYPARRLSHDDHSFDHGYDSPEHHDNNSRQ